MTKAIINEASIPSTLVLEKFPLLSFLNNRGTGAASYTIANVVTKYPAGSTLVDVVACTSIGVDASQRITITISNGRPKVSTLDTTFQPASRVADEKLLSCSLRSTSPSRPSPLQFALGSAATVSPGGPLVRQRRPPQHLASRRKHNLTPSLVPSESSQCTPP